jgi:preprotein translocase subunit SecA
VDGPDLPVPRLTVGLVVPDDRRLRRKARRVRGDITYGTNTEFGFDYLRDNMATSTRPDGAARPHFAIVDEVDSILIDEARTPLIISGPSDDSTKLYYQFASIVRTLTRRRLRGRRGEADVVPTEEGIAKVERQLGVENLYDAVAVNYVHQLGQGARGQGALPPRQGLHRRRRRGEDRRRVHRPRPRGRRWSDGLHQAVEAKERVRINEENHTWATVTLQNYFRMYEKLAGMTGTAETEAAEFASTYGSRSCRSRRTADGPRSTSPTSSSRPRTPSSRRRRRHRRALRDRPAGARRHRVGREVRAPLAAARQAGHPAHGAEREAARPEAEIVAQAGRLHGSRWPRTWPDEASTSCSAAIPRASRATRSLAEGLDPSRRGKAALRALLERSSKASASRGRTRSASSAGSTCSARERHESRRIDNQLRGRSGPSG